MTNKEFSVISADELWQALRAVESRSIMLLMPVGALTRRLTITSLAFPAAGVELHTSHGEVLTFPASDLAEIRRTLDIESDRNFVRYEMTFPSGNYFALIVGV